MKVNGMWEAVGVAGMALTYREATRRRYYGGIYGLWDEFRENGEFVPLSILAMKLLPEFDDADFRAIWRMEQINMVSRPGPAFIRRKLLHLALFDPFRLEPVCHGLDRDPRDALAKSDWAGDALDRWELVEVAMKAFQDSGALRTIEEMDFDKETQWQVDGLHRSISALIGELLL